MAQKRKVQGKKYDQSKGRKKAVFDLLTVFKLLIQLDNSGFLFVCFKLTIHHFLFCFQVEDTTCVNICKIERPNCGMT